ncbi:hypothetical protein [Streptomyces hydrogenans]
MDALGGGSQGSDCHPVLDVLGWPVPELCTAVDLSRALELPQFGTEVVRAGHDQRLELVDRSGGGKDRPVPSGEQDAQGFVFPTEPGLDQVLGDQRILRRADRVDHVGLAPSAASPVRRAHEVLDTV